MLKVSALLSIVKPAQRSTLHRLAFLLSSAATQDQGSSYLLEGTFVYKKHPDL